MILGFSEMSDEKFVEAIEACALANENFHHADHVRLIWIYLGILPEPEAEKRMVATLRKFSAHIGRPERYHHTITVAWVRLVADARAASAANQAFAEFIAENPCLADQKTLLQHFSQACLDTAQARAKWVEPDVVPLPVAVESR